MVTTTTCIFIRQPKAYYHLIFTYHRIVRQNMQITPFTAHAFYDTAYI